MFPLALVTLAARHDIHQSRPRTLCHQNSCNMVDSVVIFSRGSYSIPRSGDDAAIDWLHTPSHRRIQPDSSVQRKNACSLVF